MASWKGVWHGAEMIGEAGVGYPSARQAEQWLRRFHELR
jgi:hypothetical protein